MLVKTFLDKTDVRCGRFYRDQDEIVLVVDRHSIGMRDGLYFHLRSKPLVIRHESVNYPIDFVGDLTLDLLWDQYQSWLNNGADLCKLNYSDDLRLGIYLKSTKPQESEMTKIPHRFTPPESLYVQSDSLLNSTFWGSLHKSVNMYRVSRAGSNEKVELIPQNALNRYGEGLYLNTLSEKVMSIDSTGQVTTIEAKTIGQAVTATLKFPTKSELFPNSDTTLEQPSQPGLAFKTKTIWVELKEQLRSDKWEQINRTYSVRFESTFAFLDPLSVTEPTEDGVYFDGAALAFFCIRNSVKYVATIGENDTLENYFGFMRDVFYTESTKVVNPKGKLQHCVPKSGWLKLTLSDKGVVLSSAQDTLIETQGVSIFISASDENKLHSVHVNAFTSSHRLMAKESETFLFLLTERLFDFLTIEQVQCIRNWPLSFHSRGSIAKVFGWKNDKLQLHGLSGRAYKTDKLLMWMQSCYPETKVVPEWGVEVIVGDLTTPTFGVSRTYGDFTVSLTTKCFNGADALQSSLQIKLLDELVAVWDDCVAFDSLNALLNAATEPGVFGNVKVTFDGVTPHITRV